MQIRTTKNIYLRLKLPERVPMFVGALYGFKINSASALAKFNRMCAANFQDCDSLIDYYFPEHSPSKVKNLQAIRSKALSRLVKK